LPVPPIENCRPLPPASPRFVTLPVPVYITGVAPAALMLNAALPPVGARLPTSTTTAPLFVMVVAFVPEPEGDHASPKPVKLAPD